MALGAFPGNHQLCVGMAGMHGTIAANYAMDKCDLMISVGARYDDRITGRLDKFSVGSRKAHFDIDPTCIGKNVPCDFPVIGGNAAISVQAPVPARHLKHKDRKAVAG